MTEQSFTWRPLFLMYNENKVAQCIVILRYEPRRAPGLPYIQFNIEKDNKAKIRLKVKLHFVNNR